MLDAQATRQNIEDILSADLVRKTGPNDRLLVFFAGHFHDFKAAGGRSLGYLIPVDGPGDPYYITSRGLSMNQIEHWSELIPAKHILYVMDCGYSGLAARSSCRSGQKVHSSSFSLTGLKGAARLMEGISPPTAGSNQYNLDVELRQDGAVRILSPETRGLSATNPQPKVAPSLP